MATTTCLFCGGALAGNRAKEHVIPRWLLKHLNIDEEVITPTHTRGLTGEVVSQREHSIRALVEGNVC